MEGRLPAPVVYELGRTAVPVDSDYSVDVRPYDRRAVLADDPTEGNSTVAELHTLGNGAGTRDTRDVDVPLKSEGPHRVSSRCSPT